MRLRPYQEEAADFLFEHDRAMMLAPVGAGKTAATLTAMQDLIVREGVSRDRKSTRLNSSHSQQSRMPSSA